MLSDTADFTPPIQDTILLHHRAYHTALKDQSIVSLHSLVNSYTNLQAILHPNAADPNTVDADALIYSLQRLPRQIDKTNLVIMGQMPEVFASQGFTRVESWQQVEAKARRRRTYYHQKKMAFFIASISDVDDIVNLLLAYQIERNKFITILTKHNVKLSDLLVKAHPDTLAHFNLTPPLWAKILTALGPRWQTRLQSFLGTQSEIRLRLLAGSWVDYTKNVQKWWKNLAKSTSPAIHLSRIEAYFISSNLHSITNLLTPFVWDNRQAILAHLSKHYPLHYQTWETLSLATSTSVTQRDFLYFASKFWFTDKPQAKQRKIAYEKRFGILYFPAHHYLDINVQLIPLSLFQKANLDPRLKLPKANRFAHSKTYIINIDYPLGFAAYHVFSEVLENIAKLKGLYILGKAAVLNSEVGDLQIPRVVYDEHTGNSYLFANCFNHCFPFELHRGSLLTHQKAASVLGTFLENQALLSDFFHKNLTVIEMESGPFLSAVTEAAYPQRCPQNTIVDLNHPPFDLGIINYTSDTPYSKAKNLGAHTLQLEGIEPVYTASLVILQRIINLESHQG